MKGENSKISKPYIIVYSYYLMFLKISTLNNTDIGLVFAFIPQSLYISKMDKIFIVHISIGEVILYSGIDLSLVNQMVSY